MDPDQERAHYATHAETKADDDAWSALPLDGVADVGDGEKLEFRTCPICSSTLAREVHGHA